MEKTMVLTNFAGSTGLRWRILLPLLVGLTTLIALFAFTLFAVEGDQLEALLKHDLDRIAIYHRDSMALRGEKLTALADSMAQEHQLIKALSARDHQALLAYAGPEFERIKKNFNVTHLYFMDNQSQVLARVHAPGEFGDQISNTVTREAVRTGRPAMGTQLGSTGTYTVRAIVPIRDEDRLVGYIQLGEEVMDSLLDLSLAFGVDGYVLLYKSYLVRENWERFMRTLGRTPEWERYPDIVISAQTMPELPKAMDALLAESPPAIKLKTSMVESRTQLYNVGTVPLQDAGDRKVGRLVIVHDVTELNRQTVRRLLEVVFVAVMGATVLGIFFYFHLRRVENNMKQKEAQVIAIASAREAEQRQYTEDLIGRINELEHFEQLTVGRELRIQKLKEENRQLRKLSGIRDESAPPEDGAGPASNEGEGRDR